MLVQPISQIVPEFCDDSVIQTEEYLMALQTLPYPPKLSHACVIFEDRDRVKYEESGRYPNRHRDVCNYPGSPGGKDQSCDRFPGKGNGSNSYESAE